MCPRAAGERTVVTDEAGGTIGIGIAFDAGVPGAEVTGWISDNAVGILETLVDINTHAVQLNR